MSVHFFVMRVLQDAVMLFNSLCASPCVLSLGCLERLARRTRLPELVPRSQDGGEDGGIGRGGGIDSDREGRGVARRAFEAEMGGSALLTVAAHIGWVLAAGPLGWFACYVSSFQQPGFIPLSIYYGYFVGIHAGHRDPESGACQVDASASTPNVCVCLPACVCACVRVYVC